MSQGAAAGQCRGAQGCPHTPLCHISAVLCCEQPSWENKSDPHRDTGSSPAPVPTILQLRACGCHPLSYPRRGHWSHVRTLAKPLAHHQTSSPIVGSENPTLLQSPSRGVRPRAMPHMPAQVDNVKRCLPCAGDEAKRILAGKTQA